MVGSSGSSSTLLLLLLHALFFHGEAEEGNNSLTSQDIITSFKPSLAVVLGILLIMFFFTFILILYAKFCHRDVAVHLIPDRLNRSSSHLSGIEKTLIESLPFFRFSTLKGSKEGLECAVCLNKFEDVEILRFLPICKHAFHVDCIDRWLEGHSSCPLCRRKIRPEDLVGSNSFHVGLEVFVQNEEEKEEEEANTAPLNRANRRILLPGFMFENRWSEVNSSDLLFLDCEMIRSNSSRRFEGIMEDKRSQSEITGLSRFREGRQVQGVSSEDERRRDSLPIVRRTTIWFANRERKEDLSVLSNV